MPKNITSVRWSASEVPLGLSFDEQTGTFSGTPSEAGEYTIPVTVETNYGQDTKDVLIAVRKKMYTSCFFHMYQKQYLTGVTLTLDIHDYARGFNVDEPVALIDDGVTSVEYSLRLVTGIGDGSATLLEEIDSFEGHGFDFTYDPQTGIITIMPSNEVHVGSEWLALCIKTNLGESTWIFRIGFSTTAAPNNVKEQGIFVDTNGVWISAYINNGQVQITSWKE